jgi:hypothetical protein
MLVSAPVGAGRRWAGGLVARHFGSTTLVSRGALHDNRRALAFYRKPQIPLLRVPAFRSRTSS